MKQNFKSLNNMLHNIIQKYNFDESYANQTIKDDWIKVVNNNIFKIFKPVKIEKHVLYLHAKTEYWKPEFDKFKSQIIKKVNNYLDPFQIKDINII